MATVDFSVMDLVQDPAPFIQIGLSCWSYDAGGNTLPTYQIKVTDTFKGYYCPAKTKILLPATVATKIDLKLVVPDTVRLQGLDLDMEPLGALVTVTSGPNPQTVSLTNAVGIRAIEIRCNDSATLQEIKW